MAWNQAVESLTGYSMCDFKATRWVRQLLPTAEARSRCFQTFRSLRTGKSTLSGHWALRRKDGSILNVISSIIPGGKAPVPALVFLGETILHRGAEGAGPDMDARWRDAAILDDRGRLAAGVAHALGNQLLGVKFELHRARRAVSEDRQVEECLESIVSAVQESQEIIERFRTLDRCAPGTEEIIDPNALLVEVARQIADDLGYDARRALKEVLQPMPEITVKETPLRISIHEIVKNALEAAGPEGTVTLASRVSGDRILLSVTNTGPPLSPEVLANARLPFFTTRHHSTAGLGLCIAERALETLDGGLVLHAMKDGGARVDMHIDLSRPEDSGAELILVLDTELASRKLICRHLEWNGYRYKEQSVPQEDLSDLSLTELPDLILLGRSYPGNESTRLTRNLMDRFPDTPVLVLGPDTRSQRAAAGTVPRVPIVSRHDLEGLLHAIAYQLTRHQHHGVRPAPPHS